MSSTTTAVPRRADDMPSRANVADPQLYTQLVHWAFLLVLCIVAAALRAWDEIIVSREDVLIRCRLKARWCNSTRHGIHRRSD
jgi:hypothetical protein